MDKRIKLLEERTVIFLEKTKKKKEKNINPKEKRCLIFLRRETT